jgi:hypothetical protein
MKLSIPLITAPKNCLVNLTKDMQDLYTENYGAELRKK